MAETGTVLVPVRTKKPTVEDIDDELMVRQLPDKPSFDKERQFPGISKQKISRKDKHMKALDDYAKLLDRVSEQLEQELLDSSRIMREKLEEVDLQREEKHKNYRNDSYLIIRSEDELIEELGSLKALLSNRNDIIENFAAELDGLEAKRADILTKEMKNLVDLLISIAHQLRDEIEHIVENESNDLNTVLIVNRKAHADLLCLLRRKHTELEVESLQIWEDARLHWRHIRQVKALDDYRQEVDGPTYTNPEDRRSYLRNVSAGQQQRHKERYVLLGRLGELTADNISCDKVAGIQADFASISENEIQAVQACYDGMCVLRDKFKNKMELRVEALRKELHVYGALEREPDLKSVVIVLKQHLADESLATLWRLGGGLKPDAVALVNELSSDDVCYDNHVNGIVEKLEAVCSGFGLKEILHKRGRAAQLDKVRSLITKMRTVARADAKAVLNSIMPELEDILEVEVVPAIFKKVVSECITEMKAELERVSLAETAAVGPGTIAGTTALGSTLGGSLLGASRAGTAAASVSFEGTSLSKPGTSNTSSGATTRGGTSKSKTKKVEDMTKYIDPLLLKQWNRRLGIIYYASDLPPEAQTAYQNGLAFMTVQQRCNQLVDEVIANSCNAVVSKFDKNYKILIDRIATYLENQASFLNNNAQQVCDFFMGLAQHQEAHRKLQRQIIDKSADEMWDASEDFRIEREDREIELENACQKIRESIENDELQGHFETVLSILQTMETSYRTYHASACFKADKFPLCLINEFHDQLNYVSNSFDMKPGDSHEVLTTYDSIYDETYRLNRAFFEADPNCAGVGPRLKLATPAISRPPSAQPAATAINSAVNSNPSSKATSRQPSEAKPQPAESQRQSSEAKSGPSDAAAAAIAAGIEEDDGEGEGDDEEALDDGTTYLSPNMAVDFGANTETGSPSKTNAAAVVSGGRALDAFTGSFSVVTKPIEFVQRFYAEKIDPEDLEAAAKAQAQAEAEAAAVPEPIPAAAPAQAPAAAKPAAKAPASSKGKKEEPIPEPVVETGPPRHPDYKYLLLDANVVPLTDADMRDMDDSQITDYKTKLIQGFVELSDAEKEELQAKQDAWQTYQRVIDTIEVEKALQEQAKDAEYCRKNPPVNIFSSDRAVWVLYLELAALDLEKLVCGIRNSLIQALEREAHRTINLSMALTTQRKDSLTEELEDRLRTHWPRRGRVETQVKQPREAEILGHKEKTWRHIQNIASRMAELQRRFYAERDHAITKCREYVADVDHLRDSLNGDFRNLASLQAIDMRARATTIKFQADCTTMLASLFRISKEETNGVIAFAKDFRKVCPPQVPGVQGGYSEAELLEIEGLVFKQCDEINEVSIDWASMTDELGKEQTASLKAQEEFTKVYERVSQNLAMSEGLGQVYGAPRRRAQERIRTEVSRDEQSAGKVDELLAKIDFFVSEAIMKQQQSQSVADDDLTVTSSVDGPSGSGMPDNGRSTAEEVNAVWELMLRVRAALMDRSTFLKVIATSPGCPELVWMPTIRIPQVQNIVVEDGTHDQSLLSTNAAIITPQVTRTIYDVFDEVDASCRKETRDLYASEGKIDMLKDGSVPESLEIWLKESKEKLLGRGGYREKAWKRLWAQLERLEVIVSRKESIGGLTHADDEDEQEEEEGENGIITKTVRTYKLGAPGICVRYLLDCFYRHVTYEIEIQESNFVKLVRVWELGREKHERLLRPRLSSPDAADELTQLDEVEKKRSQEMTENVVKFRSSLIKLITELSLGALSDICQCSVGLMGILDTFLRQELLHVPPDTQVPHKRLTLKRMRKAQRLRKEVASGSSDRSIQRVWPPLPIDSAILCLKAAEDLVPDLAPPAPAAPPVPDPKAKGKAAPPPKDKKGAAPPPVEEAPTLVPKAWIDSITTTSAIKAQVSSAHRAFLIEREGAVKKYVAGIGILIDAIREKYDLMLRQESSWNQRWNRQVAMLRSGTV